MSPFTAIGSSLAAIHAARQTEQEKSEREKYADVSYTASHALMCLLTDFTPILSHLSQKYLPHHDHHHDNSDLWSHMEGEVLGDVAAVVATVAVQRLAPEAMATVRALVEPFVRPIYEISAAHEAAAWGARHGEEKGTEAYQAHYIQQYEREMSKLPMGILWSLTSLMLNSGYQFGKASLCKRSECAFTHINTGSFMEITQSNALGTLATFALTNGLRVGLPRQMRKIDFFAARHIAEPISSLVSAVTGYGTVGAAEDKAPCIT